MDDPLDTFVRSWLKEHEIRVTRKYLINDVIRIVRVECAVRAMATEDQVFRGNRWYPFCWSECLRLEKIYNVPAITIAGIIAAMSPSMNWEDNVPAAEAILAGRFSDDGKAWHLDGKGVNQYTRNVKKAIRIFRGESPFDVLPMDEKTGKFFLVIINHKARVSVVDMHDMRQADCEPHVGRKTLAYWVPEVAALIVSDIWDEVPSVCQAIRWLVQRETLQALPGQWIEVRDGTCIVCGEPWAAIKSRMAAQGAQFILTIRAAYITMNLLASRMRIQVWNQSS